MNPGNANYTEVDFRKRWPLEFSGRRELKDDLRWVEVEKGIDATSDVPLFPESGNVGPQHDADMIQEFCKGMCLEYVKSAQLHPGPAGYRKAGWIDERDSTAPEEKRNARTEPKALTATGLHKALMEKRFKHKDLPDAARRLIYVSDLDPAFIHALAATATCHQVPVLQDAIYKHLSFKTSIAVKLTPEGFLNFQLDLHLPFYVLNDTKPKEAGIGVDGVRVNEKPQRHWTDLSFLKMGDSKVWGMQEAGISLVITGSDDWRWVAYSFVDAEIDGFLDDPESELAFDQIACAGIKADAPIWEPRDYWIKIFEIRIKQVKGHWLNINQKKNEHPICPSQRFVDGETNEAFEWTLQTKDLLRKLHDVLSRTLESWRSFCNSGDINYFLLADGNGISPQSRRSLIAISGHFQELETCLKEVTSLRETCADHFVVLQQRLTQEGKKASDNNSLTSEITVSVLYPIGLATAIFSMQPEVIPFDATRQSFAFVIFLMMGIIFVIRVLLRYTPTAREKVVVWIEGRKLNRRADEPPDRPPVQIINDVGMEESMAGDA